MQTPDDLRAALAGARDDLRQALREADGHWDATVASSDDGEPWTARRTAEHAISAETYFTTQVCVACGYPGVDSARLSLASPQDALQALDDVAATCDGKLKYVTEKDLAMKHETWGDVANIMTVAAGHLHEHAAQIRTAR